MAYIGKYSFICPHGEELGKCDLCYNSWKQTGISPEPYGTKEQWDNDHSGTVKIKAVSSWYEIQIQEEGFIIVKWPMHEQYDINELDIALERLALLRKTFNGNNFRLIKVERIEEIING